MLTRLATFIGLAVATLSAAPIHYDITFTKTSGTAPAPTGGFVYDADAALGSQFSSFTLTWGAVTVDMLALPGANANFPLTFFGACVTGTSADTFDMLSGSIPCDPDAQTFFEARVDPGAPDGILSIGSSSSTTAELLISGYGDVFSPFGDCSSAGVGPGCVNVQGTLSISPTPEPATGLLAFAAGAVAITGRRKITCARRPS